MKYPIGMQSFENIRKGGFVYVDKTDLVYKLAQGHVYFLARPRRFGKSLLVSTLKAYFEGRRDLFEGLKMEALETDWTVFPVVSFDFSMANVQRAEGLRDYIIEEIFKQASQSAERKLDGTAHEALQQIGDRGYAKAYEADTRTVYKIGASFSSKTGTVEEWEIED